MLALKEKYKMSVQSENKTQENYDTMLKSYQEQLEQSQEELKNFKENYLRSATISNFESSSKDRWSVKTRHLESRDNIVIETESLKHTRPVRVS
ncbi:MAG: hypothetical protein JST59_01455 [Actinobacteria bacterium]|nr:hypothetical protein [Actinomycetota bacterium]